MRKMKDFFQDFREAPIIAILKPWKNFDRTTPLFWIFLASLIALFIGVNVKFLSLFAWVGGFLVLFFAAVAIALFENL